MQQKQKQRQSQRVVVNVNQQRRAPAKRQRVQRQPQQVVYQPLITMSGSVPVPQPYYNPSPVQSSGGFNPTPSAPSLGTPTSISDPVVLPSFAKEEAVAIGGEEFVMPALTPVREPIPVAAPENIIVPTPPSRPPPPSIINEIIPAPPPPISIISTKPPLTIDKSDKSSGKFILPPPPARNEMKPVPSVVNANDNKSVSTLLSEISRDTGINSRSVADFLFKKKKQADKPVTGSQVSASTGSSGEGMGIAPNNEPVFFTKENMSVAGAPASLPTISTRPSFYNPSVKGGEFTNKPVIVAPKEVIVIKKPEKKQKDPYDIFSEAERSLPANIIPSEGEGSLAIIPRMVSDKKPPKKRIVAESSGSEREVNVIPLDKPAGRRLPAVKEKKSSYQSKADLQQVARDNKVDVYRPNGKEKTMNELRIELSGK